MGSGKTTVAEFLKNEYQFEIVRISGKLKEIVRELELPYTRDVLQQTGDFFRQFDQLVWIRQAIQTLGSQAFDWTRERPDNASR